MSSKPAKTTAVPGVQLQIAKELSSNPQDVIDTDGTPSALALATDKAIINGGCNLGIGIVPEFPLHVAHKSSVRIE